MNVKEEIDKAIAAHAMWKHKLHVAIDTGECESTPDRVKMDCNCSFGKWLHERMDSNIKSTQHYKEVVDLHARFHKEAGTILELALNGNADEANKLMKIGSNFSMLSSGLTLKMKSWREHLISA